MTKTPAKFQKDRLKSVRGVVSTNYPSHCVYWRTDKPTLIVPFRLKSGDNKGADRRIDTWMGKHNTICTILFIVWFGHVTEVTSEISNLTVSYHEKVWKTWKWNDLCWVPVLGFNDMSTLVGYFIREREKRDSRGDEREGQRRKRNRNESEETEEIKTFPFYPYLLHG